MPHRRMLICSLGETVVDLSDLPHSLIVSKALEVVRPGREYWRDDSSKDVRLRFSDDTVIVKISLVCE